VRTTSTLRCPHRPPCPGCPRFGEALAPGGKLAGLERFAGEHGVKLELGPSVVPAGYRNRARLAIRGRSGSPKLGIFQEGSHRIADIPSCVVQHPRINEVAAALKHAIRRAGIEPYADAPHRGLLRYAQFVVERGSETVQLVLVVNTEDAAQLAPLIEPLRAALGSRLHSLFLSPNTARTNTILGPRCDKVFGPDAVHERIAGADVFFPPDAFGQANLAGYEHIVERIRDWAGDGADVLELYAGVGAIGLSLLPRAARLRCNELAPGSLRGLRMGVDALAPAQRACVEILPGGAAEHAASLASATLVIADPPRKGLDHAVRDALIAAPPPAFFYVSCDAASFLADAGALLHGGGMRLRELCAYDLFPFTDHLEVLARFERGTS
jgi:tRNA/tmRNA/rRNA uracil-C5-methylase (TrmA/RlmC/RlmD family)